MTEDEFLEAENDWNLKKLESALEGEKGDKLTPTAKKYLRGVLCGYTPKEIGDKCQVQKKAVEVTLSREVSPYIKKLLKLPEDKRINLSRVPHLLAQEKYKLEFLSSHSDTNLQPQNSSAEREIASDSDFVGREDAIANSIPENQIAELIRILQGMQQQEQKPISSANLISIPPTLENWQGRNTEIKELQTWLVDTKVKTIGIQGLSGVGKSWLASYMFESTDFGAKFWADVRQGTDFKVFAKNALMKLAGKSPKQLEELCEPEQLIFTLLDNLKERSCLLVIDNLETLLDQDRHFIGIYKDFFIRWIENGTGSKLLLTTQTQPEVMEEHGYWLPLQGLEAIDGAQLLKEFGIVGSDEELQNFSEYLNGHPKMLRLVASKLKSGTHIQEAEKIGFRHIDLLLNKLPMPYRDRERVFFVWILEQQFETLTPQLQSFLLNLSLYRTSFDQDAAAVVLTEDEEPASAWETRQALDELITRSLIDVIQGCQQYKFHPFVFQYAKRKVGNYSYLYRAKVIEYYYSISTPKNTWETLDDLIPNLESFYHFCELNMYIHALKPLQDCDRFLRLQGYNHVRVKIYTTLAHVFNKIELKKLNFLEKILDEFDSYFASIRFMALDNLGDAYRCLGQYKEAIKSHKQCLLLSKNNYNNNNKFSALNALSVDCLYIGQHGLAIYFCKQALEIALETKDQDSISIALGNMGNIYYDMEQPKVAIFYHRRALTIIRATGSDESEANCLVNLGNGYHDLGQYQQAIEFHEQGLKIAQKIGYRYTEANAWFNCGNDLVGMGELLEARIAYIEAYELFQFIGRDIDAQQVMKKIKSISQDFNW